MDFYKSFSGTDTLAFIMMPGCTPVVIGSLTTISYSMFRNKKPVINIGRTNINGVTRGSRIFAGTMVFTLINQHWLRDLQEQEAVSYLKNYKELKVDELPLFDIMIVSANEYGSAVSMYIYGIDFTDEAQTISVEDLFTENTFSFVARDLSTFEKFNVGDNHSSGSSSNTIKDIYNSVHEKIYKVGSSTTSIEEIANYYAAKQQSRREEMSKIKSPTLMRDLYLNTSHLMIGNDVAQVQTLLSKLYEGVNINGVFDEQTDKFVKLYQSDHGLNIDGIVTDKVYASMYNEDEGNKKGVRLGIVVNKNGTLSYHMASINSNVQHVLNFKDKVEILELVQDDMDGYPQKWYKTPQGYVVAEDVYSSYDEQSVTEFPTIKYQDTSVYTKIIQEALLKLFPTFILSGIYDTNTMNRIKEIQQANGLYPTGIVDNETWLLLHSLTGSVTPDTNDFMFIYHIAPGIYEINKSKSLMTELVPFYCDITCSNNITTKNSIIAKYPNGKTVTFSIDTNGTLYRLSVTDIPKALVYNPKQGDMPSSVDWIVYPLNKNPYKWTFNFI